MKYSKGYTVLEILIYASLLVLVMVLMANAIASLARISIDAKKERTVRASAEAATERIIREVRFASAVDVGASTLDTHPGVLVLTSIDPFTETIQTITFSLDDSRITVQKDSNPIEYLTSDDISVTNLVFRHMISGVISESVRTEITTGDDKFYSTTVLRRSY